MKFYKEYLKFNDDDARVIMTYYYKVIGKNAYIFDNNSKEWIYTKLHTELHLVPATEAEIMLEML